MNVLREFVVGFQPEQIWSGVAGDDRAAGVLEGGESVFFDYGSTEFSHDVEIGAVFIWEQVF